MNKSKVTKQVKRQKRHARVRAVVIGTAERPRLTVFRSLTGMFVQIIDDTLGKTLVSAHTKTDVKTGDAGERKGKLAVSYLLGLALAEKAKTAGITTVVFDRGGYRYHGRVQALAEGARDGGLQF